jgi:membrane protease subunit HflC
LPAAFSPAGTSGRLLIEVPLALVLAVPLSFLVLRHMAGDNCMERISDHEVAVVTSLLGEPRVVTTPGYTTFLPKLEDLLRLDRKPIEYVMAEGEKLPAGTQPKLIVRARDGTSFWFNSVRIQYAIDPKRAPLVLDDSGPGDAFEREIVDAYARAILRDEFGRFTPEEIVEPANRHQATEESKRRLNEEALSRHGLVVLDVAVSKPSFAEQYEATIERRKVAEQDLERMQRKLEGASADREWRLEQVRREAERSLTGEKHSLEEKLAKAASGATRKRSDADLYYAKRLSDATTEAETKTALAAAKLEVYTKEAEGVRAKALAFEAQGELAVRAALVDRLDKIQFILVPPTYRPEKIAGASQASLVAGQ